MLDAKLTQLNPRLVLSRGYAIVMDEKGAIVREAAGAPADSAIEVMFARDSVYARVTESHGPRASTDADKRVRPVDSSKLSNGL